jgi:hypothetical protein
VVDQRDGSEGWIRGMDRRGGLEDGSERRIGEMDRRDLKIDQCVHVHL